MLVIREATKEDFTEWLVLRRALWVYHARLVLKNEMKDIYKQQLAGQRMTYLAEMDGKVCGFAEISLRDKAPGCRGPHIGFLEGWLVAEGYRGQGVGRALVEKGEEWARSKGCTEMGSDTNLRLYATSPACHAALGYRVATIENNNDYHFHKPLYQEEAEMEHVEKWREPAYIRCGTVDISELVVLSSETGGPTEATYWKRALTNPYFYYICRREGELCGFVRVISDGASEAYVEDLMVAPTSRSVGIGKKLMALVRQELTAAGVTRVSAVMGEGTDEFYVRQGFIATLVGRLKLGKDASQ